MSNLNERRAEFVYQGARIAATLLLERQMVMTLHCFARCLVKSVTKAALNPRQRPNKQLELLLVDRGGERAVFLLGMVKPC